VTPVLAIDPGLKPGCVMLDESGIVVRASHKLFEDVADPFGASSWPLVATEGQWIHGRDVDANSIITLAFRAGFTLASIPAERRMRIPPNVWRGGTSANKAVVQNRILRSLSAPERALFAAIPKGRHGDVLDAIGIGRAAQRLAEEGITDYDYHLVP
jgi:hypothetical protein